MKKLIDKDAIVAEINRRIAFFSDIKNKQVIDSNLDCAIAFAGLRDFLNTLEVKEVDLESNSFDATVCKIGSVYLKEMDRDAIAKALESYKNGDKVKVIIKAQKGK